MGRTVTLRRHNWWSLAVTLLLLLQDVHRHSLFHGSTTTTTTMTMMMLVRADTVRVVPAASLYPNDEAEISTTTTTTTTISLDSKQQNPKETTTTARSDDLQRQWSRLLHDLKIMSLRLVIHPNGNASCRRDMVITVDDHVDTDTPVTSSSSFDHHDKYQMEATLTEYMATVMMVMIMDDNDDDDCWRSPRTTHHGHGTEASTGNAVYDFCDTGTNNTVIQHDHSQLIRVGDQNTLPCRFYTREGVRMASIPHLQVILQDLYHQHHTNKIMTAADADEGCSDATTTTTTVDMDGTTLSSSSTESPPIECRSTKRNPSHTDDATSTTSTLEFHLYAVPAGRVFHFAPRHIGEIFTLSHVVLPKPPATTTAAAAETDPRLTTTTPKNISVVSLEVLSVEPPIFDIHHFFSIHESELLINKALTEQSETYRFHRSTTGTSSSNVYSKRTSEVRVTAQCLMCFALFRVRLGNSRIIFLFHNSSVVCGRMLGM